MCTFSDVRVALTVTKDIGDHLLICCRLRLIIHQHVSVGLCGDVLIHLHKMGTVFGKNPLCDNVNLFSVTGTSKQSHVLSVSTNIVVKFSFRKHVL